MKSKIKTALQELAAHKAPAFLCNELGDKDNKQQQLLVELVHSFEPPASLDALSTIFALEGSTAEQLEQLEQLYTFTNGAALFTSVEPTLLQTPGGPLSQHEVGLYIRAIEELHEWNLLIEEVWPDCYEECLNDPLICPDGALVIADVPGSPNHLVLPLAGPNAGKILYMQHDSCEHEPIAESIEAFIVDLTRDPVDFLNKKLGYHWRICDNETDKQWLPSTYLQDCTEEKNSANIVLFQPKSLEGTQTLYLAVGLDDMQSVISSEFTKLPPIAPSEGTFNPACTLEHAKQLASWNAKNKQCDFAGFVLAFDLPKELISQFKEHIVGSQDHRELWIDADFFDEFNECLIGKVRLVASFYGESYVGPKLTV